MRNFKKSQEIWPAYLNIQIEKIQNKKMSQNDPFGRSSDQVAKIKQQYQEVICIR